MTISQRLVGMMGGEIKVESREGKGTTFSFNLRLKKGPVEEGIDKEQDAPEGSTRGRGAERALNILLAEDDIANQKMTMLMLRKMGHTVALAKDGLEAVEMARSRKYDIILMDIQMPNMGGLEATRKLREAGLKTPIIAMTASAMKGNREYFLKAGMDDYIAKPIVRDTVHSTLNKYAPLKRDPEIPDPDPMILPSERTVTEELGLDLEQYLEILKGFLEEKKKDMEALESALARAETDLISQLAHKIKGSSLNLRLDFLARPAANIEKAAKEGALSGIEGEWDALNRGFEALHGRRGKDGTRS